MGEFKRYYREATPYVERFYNYAKSSLEYADTKENKAVTIALESTDIGDDNVSFFTHIEDIKEFLEVKMTTPLLKVTPYTH